MKKASYVVALIFCFYGAFAQQSSPLKVNESCPDFHFTDVKYYSKKQVSLSDFKGQWLILDFWNKHCGTCIEAMPRTDSLRKEFKQVNFLLVGYTGNLFNGWTHKSDEKDIQKTYHDIRKRFNVDLPIAYDSIAFDKFRLGPCPVIIVIDPNGTVKAITTHVRANDINDLLIGKIPTLTKIDFRKEKKKS